MRSYSVGLKAFLLLYLCFEACAYAQKSCTDLGLKEGDIQQTSKQVTENGNIVVTASCKEDVVWYESNWAGTFSTHIEEAQQSFGVPAMLITGAGLTEKKAEELTETAGRRGVSSILRRRGGSVDNVSGGRVLVDLLGSKVKLQPGYEQIDSESWNRRKKGIGVADVEDQRGGQRCTGGQNVICRLVVYLCSTQSREKWACA